MTNGLWVGLGLLAAVRRRAARRSRRRAILGAR
jgi:hypothetical protein